MYSMQQPEWSVEHRSSIAACPNCFTPSYIGWTFHNVSSINSGVTVHLCLQNKDPQYLMDYCTRTSDVSSCQRLRSANRHQLTVQRHRRSTFGRRAFSVTGPMEWNLLPHSLWDPARSIDSFKSALKTIFLRHKGTYSALEALRHALYKLTTTTTTNNNNNV